MTKPILPRAPRSPATVASLARYRELKGIGVPSDEAVLNAAIAADPSHHILTDVNPNVSNTEMVFRAIERGLVEATKAGELTTWGATIFPTEQKMDGAPFWERPVSLTLDTITYPVTLFSLMRRPNGEEPDTTYPERMIDECIGMIEEDDGTRLYIYADRLDDVPQLNDSNTWWILRPDGEGGTKQTTFADWVASHHPDRRARLVKDIAEHQLAEPKGWSSGSHRMRADGRHLHVVDADPVPLQRPAADRIAKRETTAVVMTPGGSDLPKA